MSRLRAGNGAGSECRPRASVIVPTWNGRRYLPTCLDSLRRQTCRDLEVVVVDNGSSDGTVEMLMRDYTEVALVRLPVNLGFAAAANEGIRNARGDVLVLLNNDTEAEADWLAELLVAIDAAPGAGAATSKVLMFDRRGVLHTTGDTVDLAGRASNRGVWETDRGQFDDQLEVFGANAAAAAYRRSMIDAIGPFEETFGSYLEDVDLAWRARLAGWRCAFAPRAVVYHHVSGTGGGPVASYLVARNRVWLIARNYPIGLLRRHWRLVIAALAWEAIRALRAWRGREARATLRGLLVGLLTWPRMLPSRRRIQRSRRLTDAELERLLTSG